MKWEFRVKGGLVEIMLLDDKGTMILHLEGIPPDDAYELARTLRGAAKVAKSGGQGRASLSPGALKM